MEELAPKEPTQQGLYLPPSWQMLKKQIAYLAQFGGNLQVVQGKLGSGKSTLLAWLVDEPIAGDFIALSATPNMVINDFLFDLLWQLGLRPERDVAVGEYIVGLRQYVESLRTEGERVVVAIDDAHYIPDASIAAILSVLQGESESAFGLHLIFFTDFGLVDKLDELELPDVEVHDTTVPSLSLPQTEQLLYACGLSHEYRIPPDVIKQMWYDSQGLPGLILADYQSRLNESMSHQRTDRGMGEGGNGRFPIAHIAAVLLLLALLVWALLVREKPSAPEAEPPALAILPPASSESSPTAAASPGISSEYSSLNAAQSTQSRPSLESKPDKLAAAATSTLTPPASSYASSSAPLSEVSERSVAAVRTTDSALENSRSLSPRAAAAEAVADIGATQSTSSVTSSYLQSSAYSSASASSSDSSQSEQSGAKIEGISVSDKTELVPSSQAQSAAKLVSSASSPSSLASTSVSTVDLLAIDQAERELLRRPQSAYVLQLMALTDYQNLRSYALAQGNRDNLLIYRAKRKDGIYYILLEGYYADKASAQAALANLPAHQRQNKPWPKSMAAIQQDIADLE